MTRNVPSYPPLESSFSDIPDQTSPPSSPLSAIMSRPPSTSRSRATSTLSNSTSSKAVNGRQSSATPSDPSVEFLNEEHEPHDGLKFVCAMIDTPDHFDRDEYLVLNGENHVHKVLREQDAKDGLAYLVRFQDNHTAVVSYCSASNLTHPSRTHSLFFK
jgi:hypothetical protein